MDAIEYDFLEDSTTYHFRLAQSLKGVFGCQILWVRMFGYCQSRVEYFLWSQPRQRLVYTAVKSQDVKSQSQGQTIACAHQSSGLFREHFARRR